MSADVVLVHAVGSSVFTNDVASLNAILDAAAVVECVVGVAEAVMRDASEIVDDLVE